MPNLTPAIFDDDLTGKTFGRWLVLSGPYSAGNNSKWMCRCECGLEKLVLGFLLRNGGSRSCRGCSGKSRRLASGEGVKRALLRGYKQAAKYRGLSWNLSEEDFDRLTKSDCHYCGSEPRTVAQRKRNYGNYVFNGIDRVNNSCGYGLENCVSCCRTCNHAKDVMSQADFLAWVSRVQRVQDLATADMLVGACG